MLLVLGWRGEPGKRDEPQHVVQGKATPGILGMHKFVWNSCETKYFRHILAHTVQNLVQNIATIELCTDT